MGYKLNKDSPILTHHLFPSKIYSVAQPRVENSLRYVNSLALMRINTVCSLVSLKFCCCTSSNNSAAFSCCFPCTYLNRIVESVSTILFTTAVHIGFHERLKTESYTYFPKRRNHWNSVTYRNPGETGIDIKSIHVEQNHLCTTEDKVLWKHKCTNRTKMWRLWKLWKDPYNNHSTRCDLWGVGVAIQIKKALLSTSWWLQNTVS